MYLNKIRLKDSISPLIAVILLIVVAVVLVTVVLGWGKNFVNDSLDKTTYFNQEYTADTVTMFQAKRFTASNLLVKNLKSNQDVIITGYKILSDSSNRLLNTINYLSEAVTLEEGSTKYIPMVQPPEREFDVQLITDKNTFIEVNNVSYNYKNLFANVFDYNNFDFFSDIVQSSNGDYFIISTNSANKINISNISSQGDLLWTKKLDDTYSLWGDDYSLGEYGSIIVSYDSLIYANFIRSSNILKLTKLDYSGNIVLEKTIIPQNASLSNPNLVFDISKINGFYYLLYNNSSISCIIKLNSDLEIVDYLEKNKMYKAMRLDGNHLILAGQYNLISILKLDLDLGPIWEKTFDSDNLGFANRIDLVISKSNSYYVVGQISSNNDFYVAKFNNSGDLIYYEEYDLNYTGHVDRCFMMTACETSDLDLIVVGSKANDYIENFLLYSLDSIGSVNSFNILETSGHDKFLNSVAVSDGQCIFTGYSGTYGPDGYNPKPFIIKTPDIFINSQLANLKLNATPFDEI